MVRDMGTEQKIHVCTSFSHAWPNAAYATMHVDFIGKAVVKILAIHTICTTSTPRSAKSGEILRLMVHIYIRHMSIIRYDS